MEPKEGDVFESNQFGYVLMLRRFGGTEHCGFNCFRVDETTFNRTMFEIHKTYADDPSQGYIVSGGTLVHHAPFRTLRDAINAIKEVL